MVGSKRGREKKKKKEIPAEELFLIGILFIPRTKEKV